LFPAKAKRAYGCDTKRAVFGAQEAISAHDFSLQADSCFSAKGKIEEICQPEQYMKDFGAFQSREEKTPALLRGPNFSPAPYEAERLERKSCSVRHG
jgi:hypothetical protein